MSAESRIIITDGEADTADVVAFERDRRDLIRRGIAAGGAVIAASSIPLLLGVRNAFAQSSGDTAIVEGAVGIEQIAVFAYATALDSGLLDKDTTVVAKLFRDHEQEHADALISVLMDLNGTVPPKPKSVADVDKVTKGLGDVKSQADILSFAIELETAGVAAYYDANQKLQDSKLLQTAAAIMANEGQHLVVLRQAVKKDPVPNAFETGGK